jgi:hypothetical protein
MAEKTADVPSIVIDGAVFLLKANADGRRPTPRHAPNIMMSTGGTQLMNVFEDNDLLLSRSRRAFLTDTGVESFGPDEFLQGSPAAALLDHESSLPRRPYKVIGSGESMDRFIHIRSTKVSNCGAPTDDYLWHEILCRAMSLLVGVPISAME